MEIYNTYLRKKIEFNEIKKNEISMYICGPTVYNYIHIGNARPVIFFDVVKKYFEYKGFNVKFVSNFTDVDDKIIKQAKLENMTEKELTTKYIEAYLKDLESLNVDTNYKKPKVTENMDIIINYIKKLVEKEFAYEKDGDVYFRVTKIKEYGKLSNREIESLEVGARIEENLKKETPYDFTLWKKTTEGINFDSPFSKGRPGWHTECVAMIEDNFKNKIDIHGGGNDLMFPHHENEIAQSIACNNHTLANFWMHNGRLNIENEKMSKSIGNVVLVKDLENKMSFRLFMLSTQYRSPINYSKDALNQSVKEFEKMRNSYKSLFRDLDLKNEFMNKSIIKDYEEKLKQHFDNDFNTSNVITTLFEIMKEINKSLRGQSKFEKPELFNTASLYLNILGLKIDTKKLTDSEKEIYLKWTRLKKEKNFEEADKLRKELSNRGII